MDFFGAQDSARRRSRIWFAAFLSAVAVEVAVVYLVVRGFTGPDPDGRRLVLVAMATFALVLAGYSWRSARLRGGGRSVAMLLDGREIEVDTPDPVERRLINVVEEMAIAAGLPAPRVFVLDMESGINAFAAGFSPDDAAIAVTAGALVRLDRDELRAMVAHEMAHILNGDMRLNTWMLGLLYGLFMPGLVGRTLMTGRMGRVGRFNKLTVPALVAGVLLVAVGQLGMLLGRLIQAAISRQRELLADAAAVQFTRDPGALAGVFRKMGGLAFGPRITHPNAPELAHLYIAAGLAPPLVPLFSTHPPLVARIRRLDPDFDGTFPVTTTPPEPPWVHPAFADARAARSRVDTGAAFGRSSTDAGTKLP